MAAQGEVVIGISSPAFTQEFLELNAPIKVIIPSEGSGWEIDALALIKNSPQKDSAKEIIDFLMTSDNIAQLGSNFSGITARPEFKKAIGKESEGKMIDNDLKWAAKNRTRILKEWKTRFTE